MLKFSSVCLLNLFASVVFSQSNPNIKMSVKLERHPTDTTKIRLVNTSDTTKPKLFLSPNTIWIAKMIIVFSDTSNIKKLKVKFGTSDGASDKLLKDFTYTSKGTFSDGTANFNKGKITTLTLGTFTGIVNFYSELQIEYNDGSLSNSLKYFRN